MKNKIPSIGAVVLLALLTSVWAADIFGKWIAQVQTYEQADASAGPYSLLLGETIFSFKVDGTKLTGTVSDPQGETAISEGKINGDEISFVVVIRSFGGNERKLVYKGKVSLNEITFTREVAGGMRQPQEFIAKREFPRHGDVPVRSIQVPVERPLPVPLPPK
jgi:hypothetical protein